MFRVLKILTLLLLFVSLASAKYYNGSAWVDDACKYYNGTAWVDCTKNRYDGSNWVEVDQAAGSPTTISEDFSGTDLSAWTQQSGTWVLDTVNDNLDTPAGSGLISHNTELDTVTQYASVKYVSSDFNAYTGIYFRFDGNTSNYAYTVRYQNPTSDFVWRYCTSYNCTTIGSSWPNVLDDGDYYGIEVEGTGTNTIVRLWDFGPSVPARGLWGPADHTWTDNPSHVADTGKYVGLYSGASDLATYDDFEAGTYTP